MKLPNQQFSQGQADIYMVLVYIVSNARDNDATAYSQHITRIFIIFQMANKYEKSN